MVTLLFIQFLEETNEKEAVKEEEYSEAVGTKEATLKPGKASEGTRDGWISAGWVVKDTEEEPEIKTTSIEAWAEEWRKFRYK